MATTVAHSISRVMPRGLAKRLQPLWHRLRDLGQFYFRRKGNLRYDAAIGNWIAARPVDGGKTMRIVVRSYKEFRRFVVFGRFDGRDIVDTWMRRIDDCKVLYDIGSANGLEGFYVNRLWGAKVVFVEPFTPSIETILKTIVVLERHGEAGDGFEVVQAACDEKASLQRLYMHHLPTPGGTGNSFADLQDYCRGGRQDRPVAVTQWTPSITLDGLHWEMGLPAPTHVKMDVDGFEDRAMRGAAHLLKERIVRSWAIEINGTEHLATIRALMAGHGYEEVGSFDHYPGAADYTGDHIFVRDDLVDWWRKAEAAGR